MSAMLTASVLLTASACGGDAAGPTTTVAPPPTTSPLATTTVIDPTTTTVTPSTTGTEADTTTTSSRETTTSTTLAGRPIDFGPAPGDRLMVIGVHHDDFLNLRAGPGPDLPILDRIPPTFTALVAKGNTRQLTSSLWIEVDYKDTAGWVHMSFIGYEGGVTDDTSRVVAELGEYPVESTMTDLAELVAGLYTSTDESGSHVVRVTPVTTGDLAEVTYDVIGLADDAIRGVRIHVFAEQSDGRFGLESVEVTTICGRGVDADSACV